MSRVIGITFGGRRDRMEILERYVQELLCKGQITEWHIWDYTRNDSDKIWINEHFSKKEKIVIKTPKNKFWSSCYLHYRVEEYGNDVFVKFDDDTVFIDTNQFENYVNFRRNNPHYWIVSANVINNGVCAHIQELTGCLQIENETFEYPTLGFRGSLLESGKKCEKVHHYFLKNKDIILEKVKQKEIIEFPHRISINFISWLGSDIPNFQQYIRDIDTFWEDEDMLTCIIPNHNGRKNCIYYPFVISHLSFGPQEYDMSINWNSLIDKYRELK